MMRVLRGGSSLTYPDSLRGAFRLYCGPGYADVGLGFQVAWAAGRAKQEKEDDDA